MPLKRLVSAMLPLLAVAAQAADSYTCTQVIGFSQTRQWYKGGNFMFEKEVDNARWELRARDGAAIGKWGVASYDGWTVALASPCANRSNNPDRVVLTVSGSSGDDVAAWKADILKAIDMVHRKYGNVETIVLQPVVGAPEGTDCNTRAGRQQPFILEGIRQAAQESGPNVVVGCVPKVRTCNDYSDDKGHLTGSASGPIGASIGEFYAAFDGGSTGADGAPVHHNGATRGAGVDRARLAVGEDDAFRAGAGGGAMYTLRGRPIGHRPGGMMTNSNERRSAAGVVVIVPAEAQPK